MNHLPIFMNLRGRDCAVIGGGEVAARKCALLIAAGAKVTVTAPELGATLAQWRDAGSITHRAARF
ncbi:MAG TPA: NAD(P)-dependent oxidoreductase, partial [Rhodocyclaceae bacterium]|nr:NAD(P)-dependent oxidoreductase [Rhodocyclaceae bacterium]